MVLLDHRAADAGAGVADGLGRVVILAGVDHEGGAVRVAQAPLAGERQVGNDLGVRRAVRIGVDVRQVAVIRAFGIEEPVLARVVIDVALGKLELAGVGAVADRMEVETVPARREPAGVDGDPDDREIGTAAERDLADRVAFGTDEGSLNRGRGRGLGESARGSGGKGERGGENEPPGMSTNSSGIVAAT